MKTPLAVLVVQQGQPDNSLAYLEGLRRAFVGGSGSDPYPAADCELLHPVDFRVFPYPAPKPGTSQSNPEEPPVITDAMKSVIAGAQTALVILLVAKPWDASAGKLEEAWRAHVNEEGPTRVQVLRFHLATSESTNAQPAIAGNNDQDTTASRFIGFAAEDLDERDLRIPYLVLYCLGFAHRLLVNLLLQDDTVVFRFFVSHAKADGVPLATTMRDLLETRLRYFKSFYDTKDLDLTQAQGSLSQQLSGAIQTSVVIVLRTEVFDSRYWCQKEVYWAEKLGVPVVAVDGRWNVRTAPSVVSLEASPSVKIPEGNVLRILHAALEEGLRVALLRARADLLAQSAGCAHAYHVLPRRPTLVSIRSARDARQSLSVPSKAPFFVIYPNPPLPDELRDDAAEVCRQVIDGSILLSLEEWLAYTAANIP
jgi:hypothetical protein